MARAQRREVHPALLARPAEPESDAHPSPRPVLCLLRRLQRRAHARPTSCSCRRAGRIAWRTSRLRAHRATRRKATAWPRDIRSLRLHSAARPGTPFSGQPFDSSTDPANRPQGGFARSREAMMARPDRHETRRRTREMLRLLTEGQTLTDAAKTAQVEPERVLRLLDDPGFRAATVLLLDRPRHELAA